MAHGGAPRRVEVTTNVEIESIAAGGEGVAHLDDGLVVFVPRSAPGDILEIELTQRKRRYARGRISKRLTHGPGRVEPRCVHYDLDRCGGCQIQHLNGTVQLEVKREIVGEALRRIGKLDIANPDIVASQRQWRYRSKITLAVRDGRIGYRDFAKPNVVFDLVDCLLARESIIQVWDLVSANRTLLPQGVDSLVLREDRTNRLHLVAVGGGVSWDAAPLNAVFDSDEISYWWKPEGGAARVVFGPETGFPAVAFEQVNYELAEVIREAAVRNLGQIAGKTAWDLYGGVGDTAETLAFGGAEVWSVDLDRSAVEWGSKRAAQGGSSSVVNRVVGRVEDAVARLPQPDLVVVNPPRGGLGETLAKWLQRWGASANGARLAYLSCDPATLARDLARMPAFRVVKLVAYDLFPQTAHVETLTVLEAA